jgi:hypothetical protein
MDSISVDYLRIGYKKGRRDNPVVILITVGAGKVEAKEAQRVADLIHAVLGLEYADVEAMEGTRWSGEPPIRR